MLYSIGGGGFPLQFKSNPRSHIQFGSWILGVADGALSHAQGEL